MEEESLAEQIVAGSNYMSRGGDFEQWIKSKGFSKGEEARIRVALGYDRDEDWEILGEEVSKKQKGGEMKEAEANERENLPAPKQQVVSEGAPRRMEEFNAEKALKRVAERISFIEGFRQLMKEGEDYAIRKGYTKPSLEKPGAEKVLSALGCGVWILEGRKGEVIDDEYGLKEYEMVVGAFDQSSGKLITQGVGYARALKRDLLVYDRKRGMKVEHKDRAEWANNKAKKMAYKRALISVALSASSLSGYFTQDIDEESERAPEEKESLTEPQRRMMEKILQSHLLTEEEKTKIRARMERDGRKMVTPFLDWWKKEQPERERKQKDEGMMKDEE